MSDQSGGPGWWLASDGKWYPPQDPGAAMPPPTMPPPTMPMQAGPPAAGPTGPLPPGPPPKSGGLGRGPLAAIGLAVALVVGLLVFFATKDDGNDKTAIRSSSSSSSSSSSKTTTTKKSKETTTTANSDPLDIAAKDGYVPFKSVADGFAVAVPERMKVFDLSNESLDQIKAALGSDNPELSNVFDQAGTLIAQGGKLFAVDSTAVGQGKPADTLNILRTPGAIDPTTKAFSDSIVQQLEGIGATGVSVSPLDVPAGDAVEVEFTLPLNLPDGSTAEIHGHEGVVQAAGALWVITHAAGPDADPNEFSDIVNSFVAV
jgi:hypothetical protein